MSKSKMKFKTETKELLNLMIHSIYTHKDIFLRELISNASDAIDKVRFDSLVDTKILEDNKNFKIEIYQDKESKTLTIKDNGIGMDKDDLSKNLGTIARSGSKLFKEKLEESKQKGDIDIIGQFGVGFYSAFMVADKVTVITKKYGEEGLKWTSEGEDSFEIESYDKKDRGTEVILHLRDNNEEYLEEYKIRELVKKYSDYVKYPIELEVEREEGEEDKKVKVKTLEQINSMKALWLKNSKDVSDEEYNEFYKSNFHDWTDPISKLHYKVEGNIEYTALLYIPSKAPMDLYTKEYEKGLQLYSKSVFIMDKCKELLPDYFGFVKGLVDSPEFSLNISREILQQNSQLKIIEKNIEKKIQKELESLLEKDRNKYIEFFKEFGVTLKAGIYDNFGSNKDKLQDLIIFESTEKDEYVTLKEYVSRMKEDQKHIYYVAGDNKEKLKKIPQLEHIIDKGYEVLYFTDRVDEFSIKMLREYDGKEFKSVTEESLEVNKEKKEELEVLEKDNKDLLEAIKTSLKDEVKEVKISNRLKNSPVCLVSGEGMTFEMEKAMKNMPNPTGQEIKADRILEINPDHKIFKALQKAYENKKDISDYAYILYNQGLLIEGLDIDDPVEFSTKMADLIVKIENI